MANEISTNDNLNWKNSAEQLSKNHLLDGSSGYSESGNSNQNKKAFSAIINASAVGTSENYFLDPIPFLNRIGKKYTDLITNIIYKGVGGKQDVSGYQAARTDPLKMNRKNMDYTMGNALIGHKTKKIVSEWNNANHTEKSLVPIYAYSNEQVPQYQFYKTNVHINVKPLCFPIIGGETKIYNDKVEVPLFIDKSNYDMRKMILDVVSKVEISDPEEYLDGGEEAKKLSKTLAQQLFQHIIGTVTGNYPNNARFTQQQIAATLLFFTSIKNYLVTGNINSPMNITDTFFNDLRTKLNDNSTIIINRNTGVTVTNKTSLISGLTKENMMIALDGDFSSVIPIGEFFSTFFNRTCDEVDLTPNIQSRIKSFLSTATDPTSYTFSNITKFVQPNVRYCALWAQTEADYESTVAKILNTMAHHNINLVIGIKKQEMVETGNMKQEIIGYKLQKNTVPGAGYLESEYEIDNYGVNLLMPQYGRRVEVEDLNENFWVIGQTLDAIVSAIYDNQGIIDIINDLIDKSDLVGKVVMAARTEVKYESCNCGCGKSLYATTTVGNKSIKALAMANDNGDYDIKGVATNVTFDENGNVLSSDGIVLPFKREGKTGGLQQFTLQLSWEELIQMLHKNKKGLFYFNIQPFDKDSYDVYDISALFRNKNSVGDSEGLDRPSSIFATVGGIDMNLKIPTLDDTWSTVRKTGHEYDGFIRVFLKKYKPTIGMTSKVELIFLVFLGEAKNYNGTASHIYWRGNNNRYFINADVNTDGSDSDVKNYIWEDTTTNSGNQHEKYTLNSGLWGTFTINNGAGALINIRVSGRAQSGSRKLLISDRSSSFHGAKISMFSGINKDENDSSKMAYTSITDAANNSKKNIIPDGYISSEQQDVENKGPQNWDQFLVETKEYERLEKKAATKGTLDGTYSVV